MFKDPTGRFQILTAAHARIWPVVESAGFSTKDLSESDRNFVLAYMADSEINSNGMYALWFNSHGFLDTPEVVSAFRAIGAPRSAQIVDRFVRVSRHIPIISNIRLRSIQMGFLSLLWPDDDRLSSEYFDSGEDLDDLLIAHLTKPAEHDEGGKASPATS
jgi:hypothetical protein